MTEITIKLDWIEKPIFMHINSSNHVIPGLMKNYGFDFCHALNALHPLCIVFYIEK